jgi:magnesium-transporting ATPase (P-type)
VFSRGQFNGFMLLSNLLLLVFTIAIVNLPVMSELLHCVPLSLGQWLTALALSAVIVPLCEAVKLIERTAGNFQRKKLLA